MSFNNTTNNQTTNNDQTQINTPCVRFSHTTQVRFVPGLCDISKDEIATTWLTEEDIAKIQLDNLKIVKRMQRGNTDEEKHCTRGLEYMRTPNHSKQKKINKDSVRNAVLVEQRKQQSSGYCDPSKIRSVSAIHSKQAIDEAMKFAISDAAVSVQAERLPSSDSHKVNSSSEESHFCSITQSIKSTVATTAAATLPQPLLQPLTTILNQHQDMHDKSQLYTTVNSQHLFFRASSSNHANKRRPRVPKKASAA